MEHIVHAQARVRAGEAQPRASARTVEEGQAPDGAEGLELHVHTMNVIHAARVNASGGKIKGGRLPPPWG